MFACCVDVDDGSLDSPPRRVAGEARMEAVGAALPPQAACLRVNDFLDVAATAASKAPRTVSTAESYLAGRAWVPRSSDVIVATFAKSGTTLTCNICHQLRTRCGRNDFGEITQVVPWICVAGDCGQALDGEHVADPRVFKSHVNPSNQHPGCKKIYVVRDPLRVILSFYAFAKAKGLPFLAHMADALPFVDHPFWQGGPMIATSKRGNVWQFLIEIYYARGNADTLVLAFEPMVADPAPPVRAIAQFMQIEADEALVAAVVAHSSKEYMMAHASQFDDHFLAAKQAARRAAAGGGGGGPDVRTAAKVTAGGHAVPVGLEVAMQRQWDKYMTPVTGHANYAEYLADITK
ncbi:P-loop containing nucleoside triphosphate hydrolase protein [Pelagophyceae sp. CCMP2097]|nr:P-loop containing nucleoside triphosphate hydrolase protein [Pelagophyceae sp. CCMP2097]|mmetsp:Transcript_20218/g.68481  ORF Transcript_20218/g.68481 Transcript_20218/m.68481 type:complete len:349 (-) Transcript_20218:109-1155(-)